MVQFIPAKDDWADAFRQIGSGVTQGYMGRSDENALRKSIENLGPNASARDILDAITKTNTYSPESKQSLLKNYLGVKEFEELQRKAKAQEQIEGFKNNRLLKEEKEEKDKIISSSTQLIKSSDLSEDEKSSLIEAVNNGKLDYSAVKTLIKPKKKTTDKKDDKVNSSEGAIDTIQEMEDIIDRGNLGIGSNVTRYFNKEAMFDFGKYEQLGKSLIQLSTNIPIRNRQEFETLAEKLYDPTLPDAEKKGVLSALKSIIQRNIKEPEKVKNESIEGQRPPLSSFQR